MSVADTLIKTISSEVDALPTSPYGEVLFDDEPVAGFLRPAFEPDPEPDTWLQVAAVQANDTLLGTYTQQCGTSQLDYQSPRHKAIAHGLQERRKYD